ncbi:Probable non-specific lipid-transfer protein AKCS9 [Linum grandiflorum]
MVVIITSEVAAADCNPGDLLPCLPAITSGSKPTDECCGKLKDQETCLCGYVKNPAFGKYVNSPEAKKVIAACDVPKPSC